MMKSFTAILTWFRKEDGNSTIEFCIWFPFIIGLIGSSFEASLITTRQVMLAAAVDRVTRDLMLGSLGAPTHAELKRDICNRAGVIQNCTSSLHIELERIDTSDFKIRQGAVQCVDKDEQSEPTLNFTNGAQNDFMLMTVCAAVNPMVPITGLGMSLPKINGGSSYAIVAFSAFVVDPASRGRAQMRHAIRRFAADQSATITLEVVLVMPNFLRG